MTEKVTRERKEAEGDLDLVRAINIPTDLKFNIKDCKLYFPAVTLQEKCKLYFPAVTLQEKYENKLYEGLKTGISFDFEWKRYRTQIINQPETNK